MACNLLEARLPSILLHQGPGSPDELVDGLNHVYGDADGPGLVRQGSSHRLSDPPGRVGGKLVAALVFELVHRPHETDVPLLNQVQHGQTAPGVLPCDGSHQTQIGLGQIALGQRHVLAVSSEDGQGPPQTFPAGICMTLAVGPGWTPVENPRPGSFGGQFLIMLPEQPDQTSLLGIGQSQAPDGPGDANGLTGKPVSQSEALSGLARVG